MILCGRCGNYLGKSGIVKDGILFITPCKECIDELGHENEILEQNIGKIEEENVNLEEENGNLKRQLRCLKESHKRLSSEFHKFKKFKSQDSMMRGVGVTKELIGELISRV